MRHPAPLVDDQPDPPLGRETPPPPGYVPPLEGSPALDHLEVVPAPPTDGTRPAANGQPAPDDGADEEVSVDQADRVDGPGEPAS